MDANMEKLINYDRYWITIASLIGVEAGVVGIIGYQPLLIACSIFLLLFTSILVSMEYNLKRVVLHAFVWVEVIAWFTFMFRN